MAARTMVKWTVERNGGGSRHGWRVAFTGNEKPARNQLYLESTGMRQGGVRLVNPAGVILVAYWRRHAPDAKPQRIRFCIGCGCDDLHACRDPLDDDVGCHWLATDRKSAVGVCSSCRPALKYWRRGDRAAQERLVA